MAKAKRNHAEVPSASGPLQKELGGGGSTAAERNQAKRNQAEVSEGVARAKAKRNQAEALGVSGRLQKELGGGGSTATPTLA